MLNTLFSHGIAIIMLVLMLGIGVLLYRWSVRGLLTIEVFKMLFGFCLLFMIAGLCTAIALGVVEERTSFGLSQCITIIGVLSGSFAQWAFSNSKSSNSKAEEAPE